MSSNLTSRTGLANINLRTQTEQEIGNGIEEGACGYSIEYITETGHALRHGSFPIGTPFALYPPVLSPHYFSLCRSASACHSTGASKSAGAYRSNGASKSIGASESADVWEVKVRPLPRLLPSEQ